MRSLFLILCFFILSSCEHKLDEPGPLKLQPASYGDLPGWNTDDMALVVEAFSRSCERMLRRAPDGLIGPLQEAGIYADWQPLCDKFLTFDTVDAIALRSFFERHFQPYEVRAGEEPEGLFTGYYEASLRGSRTRHGPYRYPLHARPDDLVMVQLGDFREHLKGERIAGRVLDGRLHPYESRADIIAGNWPHNDKVLVWVDDPVDAFFVQIQGSGVVELEDGSQMRIGYAGQNGHPYYAIGRELIKRGYLTKETVSMQSIRAWLAANPNEADEIMNTNRSYVFFRELTGEGPLGGEGIALTAGRSLAIDRSLLPYGVPMWVDIDPPAESTGRLQKLMIAQDTGGAIRGPVRGDVFWGFGPTAESLAGAMKSQGRYWILLPRSLHTRS